MLKPIHLFSSLTLLTLIGLGAVVSYSQPQEVSSSQYETLRNSTAEKSLPAYQVFTGKWTTICLETSLTRLHREGYMSWVHKWYYASTDAYWNYAWFILKDEDSHVLLKFNRRQLPILSNSELVRFANKPEGTVKHCSNRKSAKLKYYSVNAEQLLYLGE